MNAWGSAWGAMSASDHEAQAIRLQLVELSEHILRRLAGLLARARAHSRHTYEEVEATAREITSVQRELMEELARPVPHREELDLLTSLMRVQDRSLSVLEQLERLPFHHEPLTLQSSPRAAPARPAPLRPVPEEFAPWPEATLEPSPPEPPPASQAMRHPPRSPRTAPPVGPAMTGRLQTQSSVGQPFPFLPNQSPVRTTRPARGGGPPPAQTEAKARSGPPRRDSATPGPAAGPVPGEIAEPAQLPARTAVSRPPAPLFRRTALIRGMRRVADDLWGLVRRLPAAALSALFIALGLVFVVVVARMMFFVADGLTAAPGQTPTERISAERLPTETIPMPATADLKSVAGRPLLPATGDAFVVVLSMHPDASSAQRTFAEVKQRMPAALAGISADIQPVETPNGMRYRLALAPPMPRERAFALCAEFKTSGFPACWLRRLQR